LTIMGDCKGPGCTNEANREYCSPACRARAWRERHILRCKHGDPLEIKMEIEGQGVTLTPRQPRSERSEQTGED